MEKNTIIAVVLSIAVLLGYQYYSKEVAPPPAQQKSEVAKTAEKSSGETVRPVEAKTGKTEKATDKTGVKTSAPEKTVTVENAVYKITLSSKGASVKQVELKAYKDGKGMPVVLKGDEAAPALSMGSDEGLQLADAAFAVSGSDVKLGEGKKSSDISFDYKSGDLRVRRTYTFNNADYFITVKDEVSGKDSYFVTLGRNFGVFEKEGADHHGPVLLKETDRIELTGSDVKESAKSYKEGVKWIAQEDKYFASFIVPQGKIDEARVWAKNGDAVAGLKMKGGDNTFVFYAGPKEYDILEKGKAGMEHIINFGFFSIIARPLFWFLKWINGFCNNYGLAIIILTIVTRIPFIPLINKGSRSMKKMSELQPMMAEVKEKYKSDPQKMQKEMMALYKKHKVNPVGGCLPMVLQIPFFFALYSILSTAIEMRHAPFMFWITDLAGPDNLFGHMFNLPFVIGPLPLVMGATMFIQQKMTPATGDPKQQKIMMLMPLIFTFMFLNFASGLVLFWLVNNVLSIIQQFYTNRQTDAPLQD